MQLTSLSIRGQKFLSDLTPLKSMPLNELDCSGCKSLSDLTPLQDMALTTLNLRDTPIVDLSPLRGMNLKSLELFNCRQLDDLSPLKGMKLESFIIGNVWYDESLGPVGIGGHAFERNPVAIQSRTRQGTTPFYQDAGADQLQTVRRVFGEKLTGSSRETMTQVAALQKALPNCKIEWDDPAKPAAPYRHEVAAYSDGYLSKSAISTRSTLASSRRFRIDKLRSPHSTLPINAR